MIFRDHGYLRLDYASARQYAREHLGMCERSVTERRTLARRTEKMPAIRDALVSRRLKVKGQAPDRLEWQIGLEEIGLRVFGRRLLRRDDGRGVRERGRGLQGMRPRLPRRPNET